jgi:hypothetical protein
MRGIETPAEAHLNDRRCDRLMTKGLKDGANKELKLGGWPDALLDLVRCIKGSCDRPSERQRGEWLPIDLDTFSITDEVRFRRCSVANPRGAKCRRDEGNYAPFSVGPGNERATDPRLWRTKSAKEGVGAP